MQILLSSVKQFFKAASIKKKLMLIIMSVSLIGLFTVSSSILINEVINLHKIQRMDLKILSDMLADNLSGFLVFDDAKGAKASLESLRVKQEVVRVVLYDENKREFASMLRGAENDTLSFDAAMQAGKDKAIIFFEMKEIYVAGEHEGYLFVESDDNLVEAFIIRAVTGLVIILLIGALIAYLLASRLQKIISVPVEQLTDTVSKISQEQDYSLRAEKKSDDEIGVLTDEFNHMLSQLEIRNSELGESEHKFREVVGQSMDALFMLDDEGNVIDINKTACSDLKYSRNELLRLNITEIDRFYDSRQKFAELVGYLEKEQHLSIEGEYVRKDRTLYPVEIRLGFVVIKGVRLILVSVRDITERKNAQQKLQMAYELMEAKVHERTRELKQMNKELSKAKEKAEAASRAKSLFLANMSHEIRTPMNTIIGFTDLLASSGLEERQKNYINSIQSAGRSLLSLINDILDISKIEAGKLRIKPAKVNLIGFFKEVKQVYSVSAMEKGLDFTVDVKANVPEVIVIDELRLRQIVFNLLNNALKFTRKGSVGVTVEFIDSAEKSENTLSIEVNDTGIGIAESDQQKIFKTFEQQDGQSTREFGGAGLGLAISQKLAEQLNAEVQVSSRVGVGSRFKLLIYEPEMLQGAAQDVATCVKTRQSDKTLFSEARILVVDDLKVNRELICEYLLDQPFEMLEASNGLESIKMATQYKPDLILMDVRMPKMSGIEAAQKIKLVTEEKIPVIAVTASVLEEKGKNEKLQVFDAVLFKPLSRKKLISCLKEFILSESVADECDSQSKKTRFNLAEEVEVFDKAFMDELCEYEQMLANAMHRGSFDDIAIMLEELVEIAVKFKKDALQQILREVIEANKQFDIERTQKLLGDVLDELQIIKGRCHEQAV